MIPKFPILFSSNLPKIIHIIKVTLKRNIIHSPSIYWYKRVYLSPLLCDPTNPENLPVMPE